MNSKRKKICKICGLTDGHTLINCPYKCSFCGNSVQRCDCLNSSLASGVMAFETPEKDCRIERCDESDPFMLAPSTSKRKAKDDDR